MDTLFIDVFVFIIRVSTEEVRFVKDVFVSVRRVEMEVLIVDRDALVSVFRSEKEAFTDAVRFVKDVFVSVTRVETEAVRFESDVLVVTLPTSITCFTHPVVAKRRVLVFSSGTVPVWIKVDPLMFPVHVRVELAIPVSDTLKLRVDIFTDFPMMLRFDVFRIVS